MWLLLGYEGGAADAAMCHLIDSPDDMPDGYVGMRDEFGGFLSGGMLTAASTSSSRPMMWTCSL